MCEHMETSVAMPAIYPLRTRSHNSVTLSHLRDSSLSTTRLGRTSGPYHFSAKCKKHVEAYREYCRKLLNSGLLKRKPCLSPRRDGDSTGICTSPDSSTREKVSGLLEESGARKRLRFGVPEEEHATEILQQVDVEEIELEVTPPSQSFPPRLVDELGKWALDALKDAPEATVAEVQKSFAGLEDMDYYFSMEHQSPKGCYGQGVRYLVARAFQKTKYLDSEEIPSVKEALWHFQSFAQNMSMSEKQRRRQCKISMAMESHHDFFGATSVVPYNSLPRVYGPSGVNALWNTLPIPPVAHLKGCSYSGLEDVLRHMLGLGISTDDFVLKGNAVDVVENRSGKIFHLSQSRFGEATAAKISQATDDATGTFVAYFTTFRDGFNTGHVKRNRNSIMLFTVTFAPPKERTNSTSNTFLIALGLKGNKEGWEAVERQFYKDANSLQERGPISVYHGASRKMVRVVVPQFVAMEDKVERADVTYTLSFASDYHRRFGHSIKIEKPKISVEDLEALVDEQVEAESPFPWGWLHDFVDTSANGGILPSCYNCRRRRLEKMGLETNAELEDGTCNVCADWNMNEATSKILQFERPKDYPTTSAEGCPVEPPPGRAAGNEKLQHRELDFAFLKAAARYAFYNASRRKQEGCWNQKQTFDFLRTCGVCRKSQKEIYKAAIKARRDGEDVDYTSETHIGSFEFPAPWIGILELNRHIEVLMHLIFLGIASSNMVLIDLWQSKNGKPVNTFRRNANVLIKALRVYQLSWLNVLPFGGADGKLTTGTWVSENWSGISRLMKFLHIGMVGLESDDGIGAGNVSRVVVAYSALVARLLTHSGMDDNLLDEIEDYMKEFMSAVRELDLQLRARKIDQKKTASSSVDEVPMEQEGSKQKRESDNDPWWMKSNYISLFNLLKTIEQYGPLVNLWDGGGKGEKFIPEIKIHVPKGIRPQEKNYFVNLQRRVYKARTIKIISNEESEGRKGMHVPFSLYSVCVFQATECLIFLCFLSQTTSI